MKIKDSILKKFLIVIIVIVMSANFIMPNYVYAETVGEKVVSGIFYLVAYLGDAGLSIMQKLMVGTGDLKEFGEYKIKYSPGIIFSNVVPMLDINFIGANADSDKTVTRSDLDISNQEDMLKVLGKLSKSDFSNVYEFKMSDDFDTVNEEIIKYGVYAYMSEYTSGSGNSYSTTKALSLINDGAQQYVLKAQNYGWFSDLLKRVKDLLEHGTGFFDTSGIEYAWFYTFSPAEGEDRKLYKIEKLNNGEVTIYECTQDLKTITQSVASSETITLKSTAYALKDNIAKWYIALRTFALVGLLSVLLYLGIRIVLSSTSAQNKAKYQSMLKDWLVAICILFLLHYLMAFMLSFTAKINDMFSANILVSSTDANMPSLPSDKIMNEVRTKIGDNFNNAYMGETAGFTLMYLVLVILTGAFTFQYVKRVVYMAFLTMIAPLIALTYPIDKVKDGKAQAFSFWLREYIVNCLIQPVHLLLYTLLIQNAIDFATENVLYAIIALTFIMPAEKIIKQMFGLNSQQSGYNTLGAAAGGAMVMNMLNKVKGVGPKGGGKSGDNSGSGNAGNNNVRTATRNGADPSGQADGGAAGGNAGSGRAGGATGGAGGGNGGSGGTGSSGSAGGGTSGSGPSSRRGPGALKTASNALKAINGVDKLKSAGKWTMKAGGAIAGGTIGFAAAIADGQVDDLFGKTVMGASAGAAIGNNLSNTPGAITGGIKGEAANIKERFLRAQMGDEAYENAQFDKQFYEGDGFKKILSSGSLSSRYTESQLRQQTQMFLDNGITDAGAIKDALEAGVTGDEYKAVADLGVTDMKKYSKLKNSKGSLKAGEIASRMAIAKNMPTELYNDKNAFVRYAKRYGIGQKDAESLFNDIDDFA